MADQKKISLKNVCFLMYKFVGTRRVAIVSFENNEYIVSGKAE